MSGKVDAVLVQRAIAEAAVSQLDRSERGREIRRQLLAFVDGPFAGADARNLAAVETLIAVARAGHLVAVIDALAQ